MLLFFDNQHRRSWTFGVAPFYRSNPTWTLGHDLDLTPKGDFRTFPFRSLHSNLTPTLRCLRSRNVLWDRRSVFLQNGQSRSFLHQHGTSSTWWALPPSFWTYFPYDQVLRPWAHFLGALRFRVSRTRVVFHLETSESWNCDCSDRVTHVPFPWTVQIVSALRGLGPSALLTSVPWNDSLHVDPTPRVFLEWTVKIILGFHVSRVLKTLPPYFLDSQNHEKMIHQSIYLLLSTTTILSRFRISWVLMTCALTSPSCKTTER